MGRLVLGSGSPRRQRLRREAGYDFEVVVTDAGEIADSADPAGTVAHNALAKLAACRRLRPDADILAADTLVAVTFTAVLAGIYLLFCGVQIAVQLVLIPIIARVLTRYGKKVFSR